MSVLTKFGSVATVGVLSTLVCPMLLFVYGGRVS